MVGSPDSVIGMQVDDVLKRFLTGIPSRMRPVEKGPINFNSVLIDVDEETGKAAGISRVDREWVA